MPDISPERLYRVRRAIEERHRRIDADASSRMTSHDYEQLARAAIEAADKYAGELRTA
jgi:hypothetical protein